MWATQRRKKKERKRSLLGMSKGNTNEAGNGTLRMTRLKSCESCVEVLANTEERKWRQGCLEIKAWNLEFRDQRSRFIVRKDLAPWSQADFSFASAKDFFHLSSIICFHRLFHFVFVSARSGLSSFGSRIQVASLRWPASPRSPRSLVPRSAFPQLGRLQPVKHFCSKMEKHEERLNFAHLKRFIKRPQVFLTEFEHKLARPNGSFFKFLGIILSLFCNDPTSNGH